MTLRPLTPPAALNLARNASAPAFRSVPRPEAGPDSAFAMPTRNSLSVTPSSASAGKPAASIAAAPAPSRIRRVLFSLRFCVMWSSCWQVCSDWGRADNQRLFEGRAPVVGFPPLRRVGNCPTALELFPALFLRLAGLGRLGLGLLFVPPRFSPSWQLGHRRLGRALGQHRYLGPLRLLHLRRRCRPRLRRRRRPRLGQLEAAHRTGQRFGLLLQ